MPHPTSQARAYRALRRAISLTPSTNPLRQSLQVLSNPLIHLSSHTHLEEATWQTTLNNITTFADRVIQALNNHLDNHALSSLHEEALQLHHTLDLKGFHTSFYPSHVSARTFFALRSCADSSEHTEADMRIVSTSLPATYQCLQQIFDTPVTLVDPIGTLSNVADHHRYNTPLPPNATVPSLNTHQFHSLQTAYDVFITKLNRVPIPELGRKRVQTFIDLLWKQSPIPRQKITTESNPSHSPLCPHVGNSGIVSALLHLSDNVSPDSPSLWATMVAIKTLRLSTNTQQACLSLQQETLRLKVLSHPCVPVFYGAIWPSDDGRESRAQSQHLHLVTELMTKSIRLGRHDSALRAFEVRMRILRDVADALRFLHAQQVLHGSICPENVLIRVYEDRIYGRAKVDVTCLAGRALTEEMRKHPHVYEAPESFSPKEQFFTSDVWSLGVVACFLLADIGEEENDKSFVRAVREHGKEGSVAQAWAKRIGDDRARDLVIRCLHLQPERRPNAEDVYVDISEILRQKSVKADVATPAASPRRDYAHDSDRNCRESAENQQSNHHDTCCRSLPDSNRGVRSSVNGNISQNGTEAAPGSRQDGAGDSSLGVNRKLFSNELRPCEVSRDLDDLENGNIARDLSYETGLDDIFKFQVDDRGKTRCVKRRASSSATPRPPKRPRCDQIEEGTGKSSEITAGLRQATMEVIFGPFSSSDSVSGLCKSRVKSENVLPQGLVLPNGSTASKDVGAGAGSATKVKVEATVSNVRETDKPMAPSLPAQGARDKASIDNQTVQAKPEPLLETSLLDGPATVQASVPTVQTPARKRPTSTKHEGRRQRLSCRGRRRSRSGGVDNDKDAYTPKQPVETPETTTWQGRIRKRTPRSLNYTDRSPSPAPSSSSRGVDSSTSEPSDSIFGVESSNSILRVQKSPKVDKSPDKLRTDSHEASQTLRGALKRRKSAGKATGPSPVAKQVKEQVDMSLEFIKGAKEGESLQDFLNRQVETGDPTVFVRIGILFEEGRHIKRDYGQAFSFYQRAAAAGNSEGQLRMARCYEEGRGVSKNESAAAALFIQAADADNAHAQFRAGVCFEEGRGVVSNVKKAWHYLSKSVEQRDPEACHKVAGLCREGKLSRKNESRAFELYKMAADAGHVPSMVQQANMYAKGIGVKRSIAKAVTLYRQASEEGNADAKLSLGLLHEDGQGVKKSSESALKLYREAADLGHAPAMTALGQCFLWGYGIKQDFLQAVDLFRNAAKQGDSLAQHELGNCYKEGSGVEQDYVKALYFYKKASAQGSSVALVQYGEFLYSGHGIAQDYGKAFEQFKRAADLGAAEGYRWLGECYADGTGAEQDPKKAFQMYQKGAVLGSSYAQTCLGVCYENGTGVERSKSKALQWYKKAAAEGNHTAMNNLGIFYEQGRLVKRDPKRAVSYYQKAIDLGSVDAICNLADCYISGNGIERDLKKAVDLYEDAAEHGMSGAKCELGVCYYYGKGVRQNCEKAMDLFKEASDSEPEALRHLGMGFYDGKGVQQDYIAAIRLYKKAISKGNFDANFNLALCYSYGKGVTKDDKMAASLLEIAASNGNRYAKLTLGNRYFEGRGVPHDLERAVALFTEAGEIDLTEPLTDERILSDEPQLAETKSPCT